MIRYGVLREMESQNEVLVLVSKWMTILITSCEQTIGRKVWKENNEIYYGHVELEMLLGGIS